MPAANLTHTSHTSHTPHMVLRLHAVTLLWRKLKAASSAAIQEAALRLAMLPQLRELHLLDAVVLSGEDAPEALLRLQVLTSVHLEQLLCSVDGPAASPS